MKAQCCICSDLFDHEDDANISAVACGHTFHEVCLMKWLATSNTCPHCRKQVNKKQIVRKLYFDKAEDYDGESDNPARLINEVDRVKVDLRNAHKQIAEVEESKEKLSQRLSDIIESKGKLEKEYKKEKTSSSCLRKQLAFYESQQRAVEAEREEYKTIKKKLVEMKDIECLLDGCNTDAQDLLQQYGDGEGSLKQLATYCSIIKREYEKNKTEKKLLRDELEKRRKEVLTKEQSLSAKTKRLAIVTNELKNSENELSHSEKECDRLKQKIKRLKRAIGSPTSDSPSLAAAMKEENMIPVTPVSLQKPVNGAKVIDLEEDFAVEGQITDLALMPEVVRPSPNTQMKRHCEENDVQYVKISSACDKNPAKRMKPEIQDISNLAAMNIFRKKTGPDYSSSVRKGYNGLGGYSTYAQPSGSGQFQAKKTTTKRANMRPLSKTHKSGPLPDYPKLDFFLDSN